MQSPPDPNNPQKSRPPIPETVGATSAPFELGKRPTTISFAVHKPAGPALLPTPGPARRALLRVENVRSKITAPPFDVYLNLRQGEDPEKHPERFVFTLSTFGLVESSLQQGHHPGNGLSFAQEVTNLLARFTKLDGWEGKSLSVTFVPGDWGEYPISVQVGRVSLMLE